MRGTAIPLSALILTLTACSNAPAPPAKGTPAFYWQAAQETFGAGDYRKTNEHLEHLIKTSNEFSERGKAWRIVVVSGLLRGNLDIAEKLEYGSRENKTNPAPFRKLMNDTRSVASNLATQLLETWQKMKSEKAGEIELDFPFPVGNASEVAALVQMSKGIMLSSADVEAAMKQALQRGVLVATAKAVGADDAAEARGRFSSRPVKVAGPVFRMSIADALYQASTLFDSRKLDRPDVMKMLLTEASSALSDAPEGKPKKELSTKIQDAVKKSAKKAS